MVPQGTSLNVRNGAPSHESIASCDQKQDEKSKNGDHHLQNEHSIAYSVRIFKFGAVI
jgi:hypothetical protein